MQTADFRERDDLCRGRRAIRTGLRAILGERQMRSGVMIVVEIGRQDAAQVGFIEDDDVIETLAADRTDEALDIGVLPWGARCGDNLLDPHRPDAIAEALAIRGIPVPEQVAGRGRASQICVGFRVTSKWMTLLRWWPRTIIA